MKIRMAVENDWQRIIDIYNQAIKKGKCTADTELVSVESKKEWLKEHSLGRFPIFVCANDSKEIIGWCSLSEYRKGRKALSKTAEISYYIHNDYQGQGIGSQLMKFALQEAPKYGIKNLFAILLDVNDGSIRLLGKFGFKKWGHLPDIANFDDFVCGQYIYGRKV